MTDYTETDQLADDIAAGLLTHRDVIISRLYQGLPRSPDTLICMLVDDYAKQYRISALLMGTTLTLTAYGRYGFSVPTEGHDTGCRSVRYPTHLIDNPAAFRTALAEALAPVLDAASAAIAADRAAD